MREGTGTAGMATGLTRLLGGALEQGAEHSHPKPGEAVPDLESGRNLAYTHTPLSFK